MDGHQRGLRQLLRLQRQRGPDSADGGGASFTLAYDYDDQLVSTGGAGFAYDAARRRVSRTAGGVTTRFLFDGSSVLLEKQGSATTATYTYGNSLVRKNGEAPPSDGLGIQWAVTNSGRC